MKNLLIVEDEDTLRESLKRLFEKDGFTVDVAETGEKALQRASENVYDLVLSDIILPGMDGVEMLEKLRIESPDQIVIIMTAYASLDTSVRALRAGAYDYIMKPIIHEEIRQVVNNALTHKRLKAENTLLKRQIAVEYDFQSVIGQGRAMREILSEVRKVADTKSNVLLLGETGTGKELLARLLHNNSSRRDMPFVPINCSAIPEHLLESELFGHVKGAFTGAIVNKPGLFEEADGGTVFLDEIGDMPTHFQVKLLRVIEDHEIRMLGSTKTKKVDIRFIAATNRALAEAVSEGMFREDLYYRINVISLHMPTLKERQEDLAELAMHFMARFASEYGKPACMLDEPAMSALNSYHWPGNIRELQNVIERAVLLSDGGEIKIEHLPDNILKRGSFVEESLDQGVSIEDYTRNFIAKYQHTHSEQELADKLGITRKTLWEKRKKWGLKKP